MNKQSNPTLLTSNGVKHHTITTSHEILESQRLCFSVHRTKKCNPCIRYLLGLRLRELELADLDRERDCDFERDRDRDFRRGEERNFVTPPSTLIRIYDVSPSWDLNLVSLRFFAAHSMSSLCWNSTIPVPSRNTSVYITSPASRM